MVTLQQLLSRVDAQLPNTADIARKTAYLSDALRQLRPYLGARSKHEWETEPGVQDYALPGDCAFGAIVSVELRAGGDGAPWQVYSICRDKQRMRGFAYYNAGVDAAGRAMLGLFPIPREACEARIYYIACPSLESADSMQPLSIPDGAAEVMVMYACSMLCSMGGAPDVALANLYRKHYTDALLRFSEGVSRERAAQGVRRENRWW